MKKIIAIVLVLTMALCLAACGGADEKTIKVGATPAPHAEILEIIKDDLAEAGWTLEIVEFDDYIIPNTSLEEGELDANYFQHVNYLNDFNATRGTHLAIAAKIHYEPMGLYAGKTASVDALPDGAQIAVPNDATNEARALLLLEQIGLIKLAEGAGINATKDSIVENPKNLQIVEVKAELVATQLQDVDMAVINGNYAIDAGLKIADALAVESTEGTAAQEYVNVIAVKEGNENSEKIQALINALMSDEVKNFIAEQYHGAVVVMFE